jgi:hypothetical protein
LPVLSIIETVVGKPLAALPELEPKITTGHGAPRTERVFRSVILDRSIFLVIAALCLAHR